MANALPPTPVKWLNRKPVDQQLVTRFLQPSIDSNHFSNYGPAVRHLEAVTRQLLGISETKAVIAINNGSSALHASYLAMCLHHGRRLTVGTSSFTFPASAQGALEQAKIYDIDAGGGPDLTLINPAEIEVLIVTNVFGYLVDVAKYEKWASENNKLLIFDNAATAFSMVGGTNSLNRGQAATLSFHHTKPLGFGEGGAIVIDMVYAPQVKKIMNFGYDLVKMDQLWLPEGCNFKMADPAAVYILQYLTNNFHMIVETHQRLHRHLKTLLAQIPQVKLYPTYNPVACECISDCDGDRIFPSCFPITFPSPTGIEFFTTRGIEVKKYYKPLVLAGVALDLFDRTVCFPCNLDLTEKDIDRMVEMIKEYLG